MKKLWALLKKFNNSNNNSKTIVTLSYKKTSLNLENKELIEDP